MRKTLAAQSNESKLDRDVRLWLNRQGRDYDEGWRGAYKDLMHGGCASGVVSELIYHRDTSKFYRRHRERISAMFADAIAEGIIDPRSPFQQWDSDDPLCLEDTNQSTLAWFAFEETARSLASAAGVY